MGCQLMATNCATSKNWRNQTGATGAVPSDFAPVRQLRQFLLGRGKVPHLAQHPSRARNFTRTDCLRRLRLGGNRADHRVTGVTSRALRLDLQIGHHRTMTNLAPIKTDQKPAKPRVVSRRVRHAIDLIINGEAKTQKAAAEKAGLTRERFCRALKESHVIEYLDGQTRVLLAQSRAPAAATLLMLLEQAKSEHVRKDVAVTLLGYSGIHATGERVPLVTIGLGAGPGYVLDFSTKGNADVVTDIGVAGGVIYDRVPASMMAVSPSAAERPSSAAPALSNDHSNGYRK